jgi:hypothetical protein
MCWVTNVLCGAVWCGVVWCGVVWCGVRLQIEVEAGPDEAPDRPLPKPAFVVWLFAYGYNITASPVDSTGGGPVAELFPYDDAAFDFLQQIDLGVLCCPSSPCFPLLVFAILVVFVLAQF